MGILREIMGILRVNYGLPNYGYFTGQIMGIFDDGYGLITEPLWVITGWSSKSYVFPATYAEKHSFFDAQHGCGYDQLRAITHYGKLWVFLVKLCFKALFFRLVCKKIIAGPSNNSKFALNPFRVFWESNPGSLVESSNGSLPSGSGKRTPSRLHATCQKSP